MAITDYKVSEAYAGRDISSLSDRPNADGMTGADLKARFDQLGKELIPNYNDLIDLLNAGQIESIMSAFTNGARLTILGHYDTLIELQTAHPIGIIGDMWSIGTVNPYDIYVWNTDLVDWVNIGTLVPSNTSSDVTYDNTISGLTADNVKLAIDELASKKQENLVSGTNIKTINGDSVLGSGDLVIPTTTYTVYTATIPSVSWTGSSAPFSKAVTVTGLLSTDEPIVDLVFSGTYATDVTMRENWSKIYRGVTSANTITFYADSVPSADINIQLVVVR